MTTHPEFGVETTATEVANTFDAQIRGKHILIVGVSPSSIGASLASSIASHSPALLILASRSLPNIHNVISSLPQSAHTAAIQVDLASQSSIRVAAAKIKTLTPKLDVVINNAAINVVEKQFTEEGIEMHFGVNHIGLFLLTNLLAPLFQSSKSQKPRVVNLTSAGHIGSSIRFSDPNLTTKNIPESEQPVDLKLEAFLPDQGTESPYTSFLAYAQSKSANVMFAVVLRERGVVGWSVHPGSIWTGLPRHQDEKGRQLIRDFSKVWKSGDQGAATAMVAAFDPGLEDTTDKSPYMSDCQLAEPAKWTLEKEGAERLWRLSEEMVGEKFDFRVARV